MSRVLQIAACAAMGVGALMLAGCSGASKNADLACPKVMSLPETQNIAIFGPGGHQAKDVMVGGRIRDIQYNCRPERVGFAVVTDISFEAQRADSSVTDTTLPYFVALIDPSEHVVGEQAFKLAVKFLPGEAYRRMPEESITVHVPLRQKSTGGAYTVIVGFQLTPEQIAFNRATHPQ